MSVNDYGLKAYKKAQEDGREFKNSDSEEKPKSISREIRRNKEPGHEPLVTKAVFENVNKRIDELSRQKDAEALKQAKLASRTGTWFEKKTQI